MTSHPIVSGVSDTTVSLSLGQEIGTPIESSATGTQGMETIKIDEVNAGSCVGQPGPVLIGMGSPRGGEGSPGGANSHEGVPLTSGTARQKERSGSAKKSKRNAGGSDKTDRHQRRLKQLSK